METWKYHSPLAFIFALLSVPLAIAGEEKKDEEKKNDEKKREDSAIRFVPLGKEGEQSAGRLESAIITFEGKGGVRVELVAAVHIADKAYYAELSKLFEGYDALLYEMVKPKDYEPGPENKSTSLVSAFQRGMKDLLALEFQLDGIDYSKRNFVHADLDAETFTKLQSERGENLFTLMLQAVLEDLKRQAKGDSGQQINPFELLAALLSKDRSRSLKLLLARQFQDLEERLQFLEGEKGSVLLTERNKAAVAVLKKTIADGKKNIGVFYGGAHLRDLSKRLRDELGFKEVGRRWLVAWDIPPVEEKSSKKGEE